MSGIYDVELWKRELGILAAPLYPWTGIENRFVMLNGSTGNFCLSIDREPDPNSRSEAWSTNVPFHVTVFQEQVYVQSWAGIPTARYAASEVAHNLDRFRVLLEDHAPNVPQTVIEHSLTVFRKLWGQLGESVDGRQALSAFLYMLACTIDGVERRKLDTKKWGLEQESHDVVISLDAKKWTELEHELRSPRKIRGIDDVEPIVPLILQHASGQLFQEAHKIAFHDPEMTLFGDRLPVTTETRTHGTGVHYTPPSLVRSIVETCLHSRVGRDWPETVTVFDPACGSGEFLREAVRQLESEGFRGNVRLKGWDNSPIATMTTKFGLAWEKQNAENIDLEVEVLMTDSLGADVSWPTADVLLMNPPFVAWQDLDKTKREELADRLGDLAIGRPDLATVFLKLGVDHLALNGVIGTVTPASFFDARYARPLRRHIINKVNPYLVARLGSHDLFRDVRVDAGLLIATSDKPIHNSPPLVIWADHRSSSYSKAMRSLRRYFEHGDQMLPIDMEVLEGFSIYRNDDFGRDHEEWGPRPFKSWKLLRDLKGSEQVANLFTVMQGVRTGLNRAFILSVDDWERLDPNEQAYFRKALVNRSINEGRITSHQYIFYPYLNRNIESENELISYLPNYYNLYLKDHKSRLRQRRNRFADEGLWWQLSEPNNWQKTPLPKIVSTYFGDRGSFAWDEKGDFTIVQGYGWMPKNTLQEASRKVWLAYLAVLNSEYFFRLIAARSNHLGGGQWDLSKRFLEELPLPNLTSDSIEASIFEVLSDIGTKLHHGQNVSEIWNMQAWDDAVDSVFKAEILAQ